LDVYLPTLYTSLPTVPISSTKSSITLHLSPNCAHLQHQKLHYAPALLRTEPVEASRIGFLCLCVRFIHFRKVRAGFVDYSSDAFSCGILLINLPAGLAAVKCHIFDVSRGILERRVGRKKINGQTILMGDNGIGISSVIATREYVIVQHPYRCGFVPVACKPRGVNGLIGLRSNDALLVICVGISFIRGE